LELELWLSEDKATNDEDDIGNELEDIFVPEELAASLLDDTVTTAELAF